MAPLTRQDRENREWFKAEVATRLEALGASHLGDGLYLLDTCIGSLKLRPQDGWVPCQWVDVEHVKHIVRDGRLTVDGVWNHLYDVGMFSCQLGAQAAVDDFFSELSVFLPPNGWITAQRTQS